MATATEEQTEAQPEPESPAAPAPAPEPDQGAAHAALELAVSELPAIPGRDEFLVLCQLARVYASSSIVPKALRDKPNDVLVVLMTGRDLGIPATAALRKVYVIDGQPSIAPQLKLSLIRSKRLGQVIPHPENNNLTDRQGAIALGPNGKIMTDQLGEVIGWTDALGPPYWYTWDDAIRAALVREGCTPEAHTAECVKAAGNRETKQINYSTGKANFCKDNWRKNPRRMLWQRASGFCADDYFAEATLGLYDPDELGAMLGDDGELIDVGHVELPAGFGGGNGGGGDQGGDPEPVAPEDAWGIQVRVYSLPEDAQAEFKDRWLKAKVPGNLRHFPAEKLNLVSAFLKGVEGQWKAQGLYDPATGPDAFSENVLAPCVAVAAGMPAGTPARERPTTPPAAVGEPEPPDAPNSAEDPERAGEPQGAPDASAVVEPAALPLDAPEAEADTEPLDHPLLVIPDEVWAATPDDKTTWVIAFVRGLRIAEVDTLLRHFGRPTEGSPSDRRQRASLAIASAMGVPGLPGAAGPR